MKRTRDEIESDVVYKTREERLYNVEYSCDDRRELAEYIVDLEDELVLEMMLGECRITIDAEELAGRLRHLGVRADQPIDLRKWATNE